MKLAALIRPVAFALILPIPPPLLPSAGTGVVWSDAPIAETAYARLLARHVRAGTIEGKPVQVVDYAALRRGSDLEAALEELAAARPDAMSADDRLAFWINAYNLLAIRLVADAYPIDSIKDLERDHEYVWTRVAGTAGGRAVSLSDVVDHILRRQFHEPRIHFALVAAALSCPDLPSEPYDGARIDAQLAEATTRFLADPNRGIRITGRGVAVSPLLFQDDFMDDGGVVAFLRAHAPPETAARLRGLDHHDLGEIPYDWSLNDAARAGS